MGQCWLIGNEDVLAAYVAQLIAGQSVFLRKITGGGQLAKLGISKEALKNLKEVLAPGQKANMRYIRDGWLFQMISWIAVRVANPKAIMRAPQAQPSAKGIDTLYLELLGPKAAPVLTIGEDKATKSPRKTIQTRVWPEFKAFEDGARDAEIVSEVSLVLANEPGMKALVEAALWREERRFRVSVTSRRGRTSSGRSNLFKGYAKVAPGSLSRRQADTFHVRGLRAWMEQFAARVVVHLEAMKVM